jgi:hypothetical protein
MAMPKEDNPITIFLFTYGWAMLVVIAAIGALVYFDVLDPINFIKQQNIDYNECGKVQCEKLNLTFNSWKVDNFDQLTVWCGYPENVSIANITMQVQLISTVAKDLCQNFTTEE